MRLALIAVLLCASLAMAGEVFEATDAAMVTDLARLESRIDAISDAVTDCVVSGRTTEQCLCDNEEMVSGFSVAVDTLFAKHPELEHHDLVSFKDPDGEYVTLSMKGIKMQADAKLSCE